MCACAHVPVYVKKIVLVLTASGDKAIKQMKIQRNEEMTLK